MRPRSQLGCVLVLLLTAHVVHAQEAKLPDGLRHVPPDAFSFIHVRVADFRKSEAGQLLMAELLKDREAAGGLKQLKMELGIELADVETVTVLILTAPLDAMAPAFRPGRGPIYDKKPAFDPPPRLPAPFEKKPFEDKKFDGIKESPVVFQEFGSPPFLGGPERIVVNQSAVDGPLVIVASAKPFDRKSILKSQLFGTRPDEPFARSPAPSVLFLSDRTIVVGAASDLGRYSEAMARKPGPKTTPLKSALALGAKPHLVVAGGYVPMEFRRMMFSPRNVDMRALAPIAPLLSTEAGLTLDLGKTLDLTVQFDAPTEAGAANALEAAKTLRVMAELALEKSQGFGAAGGWKLDLDTALAKALAQASFQKEGKRVTAQLTMDVSTKLAEQVTKGIVSGVRSKGDRTRSANNLKQIGLALHGYHDANRALPPAGLPAVNDPNGKPLLSWRVAILPYIEQAELYRQFDLTKPWDHPTNKALIAKMPALYIVPGTANKPGETNYRVLVGPGTMFEPRNGNRGFRLTDILDGTSNTIMAVEAAEPTIWTRPDDLPYDPKGALPRFGTSPDGFNMLLGDGTVRFVRAKTPPTVLRALITRNGGEVVDLPEDR